MDVDWERELDRAIERGPDRPPSDYLGPGRASLRRRRIAVGTTTLATILVLGVGATLGGAAGLVGGDRATPPDVAVDPTEPPSATRDPGGDDLVLSCAPAGEAAAGYDDAGRLCLAPDAGVLDRVEDPLLLRPDDGRSVALEVDVDGNRQFVLLSWRPDGSTSTSQRPAAGALSDWTPSQVAARQELDGPSLGDRLALAPSGELVAGSGIDVVEVRDVDLGADFAPPGAPAVAAEVEVDGQRELVLLRRIEGTTDVIRGSRAFGDLDAFVADARERYASGEGVL